jgi:hypothetical protein
MCPLEIPKKQRSRLKKTYEISPESVSIPLCPLKACFAFFYQLETAVKLKAI